jgi:hypothetical protein
MISDKSAHVQLALYDVVGRDAAVHRGTAAVFVCCTSERSCDVMKQQVGSLMVTEQHISSMFRPTRVQIRHTRNTDELEL